MLFKFKKSKINLDCFTYLPISELFPIAPSQKVLPAWFRSLPPHVSTNNPKFPTLQQNTMKGCAGINDYFKNSITITNWIEHRFSVQPDRSIHFMGLREDLEYDSHPKHIQMGNAMPDCVHIKIPSPWQFKEKTGVNWAWIQSSWHMDDPCEYSIPPGIVNYQEQHTTNVNALIPCHSTSKEIVIPAGQPLVQLVPMSDKDVDIHMHQITYEEWVSYRTYSHSSVHNFLKTRKILKSNKG